MRPNPAAIYCYTVNAAALVLFAIVIVWSPRVAAEVAVCITGDINVAGLGAGTCIEPDDLDALWDRPVRQGSNQAAEFKMTSPDDMSKQESVVTCRDYEARRSKNWYALTGADMAKEGWFQRTCETIAILEKARPSKRSYLDDPDTGLADPALITSSILPASEDQVIEDNGKTIAEFVASGAARVDSAGKMRLELTYDGMRAVYEELARGDFDRDGAEDMLVFMGVYASAGSLRWYRLIGLSRTAPGEALRLMSNEDV